MAEPQPTTRRGVLPVACCQGRAPRRARDGCGAAARQAAAGAREHAPLPDAIARTRPTCDSQLAVRLAPHLKDGADQLELGVGLGDEVDRTHRPDGRGSDDLAGRTAGLALLPIQLVMLDLTVAVPRSPSCKGARTPCRASSTWCCLRPGCSSRCSRECAGLVRFPATGQPDVDETRRPCSAGTRGYR